MTELTALDLAHAAMEQAPSDDAARLQFFERLSDAELFILLTKEADGEAIEPEVFDVQDSSFVLVFDREERLAAFTGKPAPYAALSGRVIVGLLAGQGMGLGLNLDVAPSAILLPPEALDWLAQTLSNAPDEAEARIEEVLVPGGLPEPLLGSLDAKLATTGGLARSAYLAAVRYEGGGAGHVLAFVDAVPEAQAALAKATAEALTFSGIEAGSIDVVFLRATDARAAAFAKVGLRFDLPEPAKVETTARPAPGSDPDNPPKLR